MRKLAYRKAFGDAYEYAMSKIAGCCGGRGGQTMVVKHGGGVPNEDYGLEPGTNWRTYSNAKLDRNVDDALRIGGRGKNGYTAKFYNSAMEKKYRKALAGRGLKSAPDMDTYRNIVSGI